MKAAQLVAPKRWEFTEVETPTAADGQVLVKMERVSVCGSDIRHTYGPVLDESEYPLAPCRGAHELAGVIVDSKTEEYHEGQRVIVIPFPGTGGLCEYVLSAPGRIAVLPEYGGLDEWVLCQPPGTVLYSCRQIGSPLQQNILIFGQGSIGLSFTMILSRMGARNVIVVDPLEYRLEKSKQMGSTHRINPDTQDVHEAVMEITKGRGPDVCVEAAGYPDSLNECFRHVRQFGQVIVFGVQTDHMVPIEHNLWMDKQPRITPTTGARSGDPISQIQDMVDLRARGWADPAELITHRVGFSEVQNAYDMYEQRQDGVIKVVMDINS